jgi:hypothetical protein
MKTPFTVMRKAQQFPRIPTHLMMAEYAETCSEVKNFNNNLFLNLDIVAWWTLNNRK